LHPLLRCQMGYIELLEKFFLINCYNSGVKFKGLKSRKQAFPYILFNLGLLYASIFGK
jgi:hypothetical protein